MATDPYHAVQQEIQTTLQTATQLRASYARIRNLAVREDSEELVWARNELKATLAALEADLEDLDESVKMVESTDSRLFGLEYAQVQERRRYVGHVRREIENMRAEVSPNASKTPQPSSSRTPSYSSNPPLSGRERGTRSGVTSPQPERDANGEDHQGEWAREEQQMMMREQDRTIDSIAGTLNTLVQQAGLMGQEISEHNELLDDLEQGVDRTDTKLNDAMRKMRKFLRDSEERGSGWCIIILVIVLMVLLLVVILI